jgi:hypothetical protein
MTHFAIVMLIKPRVIRERNAARGLRWFEVGAYSSHDGIRYSSRELASWFISREHRPAYEVVNACWTVFSKFSSSIPACGTPHGILAA